VTETLDLSDRIIGSRRNSSSPHAPRHLTYQKQQVRCDCWRCHRQPKLLLASVSPRNKVVLKVEDFGPAVLSLLRQARLLGSSCKPKTIVRHGVSHTPSRLASYPERSNRPQARTKTSKRSRSGTGHNARRPASGPPKRCACSRSQRPAAPRAAQSAAISTVICCCVRPLLTKRQPGLHAQQRGGQIGPVRRVAPPGAGRKGFAATNV